MQIDILVMMHFCNTFGTKLLHIVAKVIRSFSYGTTAGLMRCERCCM